MRLVSLRKTLAKLQRRIGSLQNRHAIYALGHLRIKITA